MRNRPTTIDTIDQHFNETLPQLKERQLLGEVGNTKLTNGAIFTYALALGYSNGMRKPLKKVHSGGWFRTESLEGKGETLSILDAIRYKEEGFESADVLEDYTGTYALAQEYANAGLFLIAADLETGVSPVDYITELMGKCNDLYDQIESTYHGQ